LPQEQHPTIYEMSIEEGGLPPVKDNASPLSLASRSTCEPDCLTPASMSPASSDLTPSALPDRRSWSCDPSFSPIREASAEQLTGSFSRPSEVTLENRPCIQNTLSHEADVQDRPSPLHTLIWRHPIILIVGAIQAVGVIAGESWKLVWAAYGQIHIGSKGVVSSSGYFKTVSSTIAIVGCGLMGRVSDIKGRRFALASQISVKAIPIIYFFVMGENDQSYWMSFWMSAVLGGLVGNTIPGAGQFGPIWSNTITDATSPADRPQAQALAIVMNHFITLPLQWAMRRCVNTYHNDTLTQIIGISAMGVVLAMIIFLVPSARKQRIDRRQHGSFCNSINPIAPARIACSSMQIAMLCAVAGLVSVGDSLPHSPTATVYIHQQLGITKDRNAQQDLEATSEIIRTVSGPFSMLTIPLLTRCFNRLNCLYLALLVASLTIVGQSLVHFHPYPSIVYMVQCGSSFQLLPNVLLISLISEKATTPQQVGTCLGAMYAVRSLIGILSSPIETTLYNVLERHGWSWVTWIIFGGIMLSAAIPLTVLKLCSNGAALARSSTSAVDPLSEPLTPPPPHCTQREPLVDRPLEPVSIN